MDLFITNIQFQVRELEIEMLFKKYGQVESVTLIKDKITRKSKGFGFVKMPNTNEALTAIEALNNHEIRGRKLIVSEAEDRGKKANRNDITFESERKKNFNKMVRSQNGGKFMSKKKRDSK